MKKLLHIIFLLFHLVLFAQNPVTQETTYRLTNENEWRKVSVLDNTYQNGLLIKTAQRTYNSVLDDWFLSNEEWFDSENRSVRKISRSFISRANGFFVRDNQFTYNETGQLILTLAYSKRGNDQPLTLDTRTEVVYFDGCSYLESIYVPDNRDVQKLVFSNSVLALYDAECRFVRFVFSTRETDQFADLQQKVRVRYETLPNNESRRIVEELACPLGVDNCDQWDVKERLLFDEMGRDIQREIGSVNDFVRTVTDITYESDQKIFDIKTFINLDGISQRLTGIELEILALDDQLLYRRRLEPFAEEEWNYKYTTDGLIEQEVYQRNSKSAAGINVFNDTTNYNYQFYCDELVSEVITRNQNNQTRTTYNYLHPTDCGIMTELNELSIFPNPANNTINISNNAFINNAYELEIYDSQGRFIRSIQNSRGAIQSIEVADLQNGVYYLSIPQGNERTTQSFVVNR